jgi:putative lipoprotein (rSAM/lipoprotein system)
MLQAMIKVNQSFLRFRAKALKYVLGLLGMGGFGLLMSCAKYGAPIAEYGVPYNDNFINFHGNVLSEDSLKPVPNIRIKIYSDYGDTLRSATNGIGDYSLHKQSYENQKVTLVFTDEDSTQNGRFFPKTVDVDVSFRDMNNLEHETDVTLQRKP